MTARAEIVTPVETPAPHSQLQPIRGWAVRAIDSVGRALRAVESNYEQIESASRPRLVHTASQKEDDPKASPGSRST